MTSSILFRPIRRSAPMPAVAVPTPAPHTKRARATADATHLAERHAVGGRIVAAARRDRSSSVIFAAVERLAVKGKRPTQTAVLAVVAGQGVTSERTIRRHWPFVLAALRPAVVPVRPMYPTDTCLDFEAMIREFVARGESIASVARVMVLDVLDVSSLFPSLSLEN